MNLSFIFLLCLATLYSVGADDEVMPGEESTEVQPDPVLEKMTKFWQRQFFPPLTLPLSFGHGLMIVRKYVMNDRVFVAKYHNGGFIEWTNLRSATPGTPDGLISDQLTYVRPNGVVKFLRIATQALTLLFGNECSQSCVPPV